MASDQITPRHCVAADVRGCCDDDHDDDNENIHLDDNDDDDGDGDCDDHNFLVMMVIMVTSRRIHFGRWALSASVSLNDK